MSYKFRFDEKKCTGCFACHTACLDAHYGPGEEGISLRSIKKDRGGVKKLSEGHLSGLHTLRRLCAGLSVRRTVCGRRHRACTCESGRLFRLQGM